MFKPIYIYDEDILSKLNWFKILLNPNASNLYIYKYGIDQYNKHKKIYDKNEELYQYSKDNIKQNIQDRNACLICVNPYAIDYIEKNINDINIINWFWLSINSAAIHLLKINKDKVNYFMLSDNININEMFDLNKKQMKENANQLRIELCEYIFDYNRLMRISKIYSVSFYDVMQSYKL